MIGTDPAFDPPGKPVLPYAGTSGRGGSAASAASKARQDGDGTTGMRQSRTLALLAAAGPLGMTYRELCERTGWMGGQATGTLSAMHKEGLIARLAVQRREHCSVYVAPEFVGASEVAQYNPNRRNRPLGTAEPVPELTIDESITVHNVQAMMGWNKSIVPLPRPMAEHLIAIIDRLTGNDGDEDEK